MVKNKANLVWCAAKSAFILLQQLLHIVIVTHSGSARLVVEIQHAPQFPLLVHFNFHRRTNQRTSVFTSTPTGTPLEDQCTWTQPHWRTSVHKMHTRTCWRAFLVAP
jgi:hypothetical protein